MARSDVGVVKVLGELGAPLWVRFSVALVPVCGLALLLEWMTGPLNLMAQAILGISSWPIQYALFGPRG
jgi:hypothetical protein